MKCAVRAREDPSIQRYDCSNQQRFTDGKIVDAVTASSRCVDKSEGKAAKGKGSEGKGVVGKMAAKDGGANVSVIVTMLIKC